jgi:hypothetical protein
MTRNLAARQLAQTRRDMERDLKRKDREKLKTLRGSIQAAKRSRKTKLREVGAQCREARRKNIERAKRARVRLRESIQRTRERARGLCTVSRGEAYAGTLREIEKAVGALEEERALQRQLAVWTKPTKCALPRTAKARERREESDCEVSANIDDPGLRVVWERVKAKIKGGPRRSRTESFLEWAHDHPSDVYTIQEADAERALVELEREERRLSREVKKTGRYRKRSPEELAEMLAAVPF